MRHFKLKKIDEQKTPHNFAHSPDAGKMIQQPSAMKSNPDRGKRSLSKKKLWLFRFGAVTLSVLTLLAVEGVLRLCEVGRNLHLVIPASAPVGDFTHEFNIAVEHAYFKSDLLGPETRQFQLPKPKGTYRIVVLGASTVIGFPYPAELAFPRQIEVLLELQNPDLEIEVLNAGITALNSFAIADLTTECLKSDPDLIILYAGHNEFYGPGGVSSKAMQVPPGMMEWAYWLRRLRISQLLKRPFLNNESVREDLMNALPKNLQIPLDDPIIEQARVLYEENLNSIVAITEAADVPLILSTVASNLRDQSPMRAMWPPDISMERMNEWNQLLLTGESFLIQGDYDQATDSLAKAAEICQDHARLVYRQAQCAEGVEEMAEARVLYARARDLDACRFRSPSFFADVIRIVSAEHQISLVDIEEKFNQLSPAGPGYDLFLEHVHFKFEGHRKVAQFFAEEVQQNFLNRNWSPTLVPDNNQTEELLGMIPEDSLTALTVALEVLETVPNSETLDKVRHRQHLLNEITKIYHQIDVDHREAYIDLPMDIAAAHLLAALIRTHLDRGNQEFALELAEIAVLRRPWDAGAVARLKRIKSNTP